MGFQLPTITNLRWRPEPEVKARSLLPSIQNHRPFPTVLRLPDLATLLRLTDTTQERLGTIFLLRWLVGTAGWFLGFAEKMAVEKPKIIPSFDPCRISKQASWNLVINVQVDLFLAEILGSQKCQKFLGPAITFLWSLLFCWVRSFPPNWCLVGPSAHRLVVPVWRRIATCNSCLNILEPKWTLLDRTKPLCQKTTVQTGGPNVLHMMPAPMMPLYH